MLVSLAHQVVLVVLIVLLATIHQLVAIAMTGLAIAHTPLIVIVGVIVALRIVALTTLARPRTQAQAPVAGISFHFTYRPLRRAFLLEKYMGLDRRLDHIPPLPSRVEMLLRASPDVKSISDEDPRIITQTNGRVLDWVDCIDRVGGSAQSVFKRAYHVITYNTMTLNHLILQIFEFGLDFDPPYQRKLVWTPAQEQAFIESLFDESIDLGRFVLVKRDFSGKKGFKHAEILDGKQRLTTLRKFIACEIPFKKAGLYYVDLCVDDKRALESRTVSIGEIPESFSLEQRVQIFIKLNKAGTSVSRKHINSLQEEYLNG